MVLDSRRPNPRNSIRLQKYLADCGFGSRRACEALIEKGVVTVDGKVVREQGVKIEPGEQEVRVDGKVAVPEPKVCLALNKPRGYLCTSKDPQGRRTFKELLPDLPARVYTVGRLDYDSEGLLIVTNDGQLCNHLIHPRNHVEKVYSVVLSRRLSEKELAVLRRGMTLQGERMRVSEVKFKRKSGKGFIYRIVLKEGKNRQIRRMANALGVKVKRLRRTRIGSLELGSLKQGDSRRLTDREVAALRQK